MSGLAVYDNPETGQREFYRDGEMVDALTPSAVKMVCREQILQFTEGTIYAACRDAGEISLGQFSGDFTQLPVRLAVLRIRRHR